MISSVYQLLNQNIYGYIREFGCYSKYIVSKKHTPRVKFVIFGRGRSGSTLLVSLLNSCPDLFCDQEILNRKVFSPATFINCRSELYNKDVYGFKFLSYQLRSVHKFKHDASFLNLLHKRGFKFIFITRENALRQCLSKMYAAHRSQWHQKEQTNLTKMNVNLDELLANLKESERLDIYERNVIADIPHIEINYEKDLLPTENHQQAVYKLANYLGIQSFKPVTNFKKITSNEFSSYISNTDEMIDFVIKNGHKKYL